MLEKVKNEVIETLCKYYNNHRELKRGFQSTDPGGGLQYQLKTKYEDTAIYVRESDGSEHVIVWPWDRKMCKVRLQACRRTEL